MRVVVVAGAGASLAQAQSFRPQQTQLHPPLDTTFFAKALQVRKKLQAGYLDDFIHAIDLSDFLDPFSRPSTRMETVFGDLYYEIRDGSRAPSALDAYRHLLRLYMNVLTLTTTWFHNRRGGVVDRFFEGLLRQQPLLTSLTIVTFNHDLVIENIFANFAGASPWCLDHSSSGYGPVTLTYTPSARTRNTPRDRLPRHNEGRCDHTVPVQILKLHGSLNWQTKTRSHIPSFADLFPTTSRTLECITDRTPSAVLRRQIPTQRPWRLWPQLVPPVYDKQALIANRYAELWRLAGSRIEDADVVYFVGYSLPVADQHTEKMFSRSFADTAKVRSVVVVNPEPALAERFASVCSVSSLYWYRELGNLSPSAILPTQ